MKIKINKNLLLNAVNQADQLTVKKNASAALGHCLFDVGQNELSIQATDLENSISITIPCDCAPGDNFLIDGKKLSSIIKELPDDEITMEVSEDHIVKIKSQKVKGKFKIIGLDAKDFPAFPEVNKVDIEINQIELKKALEKVIHAASIEQIKPIFNAVYFSENKLVATDSRRIALSKINSSIGQDFILPLKTVGIITKLLNDGFCNMSVNNNVVHFEIDNIELSSRVIDGQFPNYKSIIPKESNYTVKVETEKLMSALKRALIFIKEPANKIIFDFNNDVLKISVSTADVGESLEEMSIDSNCQDMKIGFNCKFLLDALKNIDSKLVEFGITKGNDPVVIRNSEGGDYLSVVMPIVLKKGE